MTFSLSYPHLLGDKTLFFFFLLTNLTQLQQILEELNIQISDTFLLKRNKKKGSALNNPISSKNF